MSSKAVVSQNEVNERRLKGIFDQIEAFNYKKAISEADKVLKKDPNLLPAKVLKGFSLFKQNKSEESHELVESVVNETPTDEQTLNALSYFYRETNQRDKIISAYSEAFKLCPTREDLCANLFYCHVRCFDFTAQQKVAQQLKKLNPKNVEYPMWPIVSNVMSGLASGDARLVKLGEAMLSKLFKGDDAILSMERVQFLIFSLQKQNKTEEALNWLNSYTLKDVVLDSQNELTALKFKVQFLRRLNKKKECLDLYWLYIKQKPSDIGTWREYIDLSVDLNATGDHSSSETGSWKEYVDPCVDLKISDHSINTVVKKIIKINQNVELLSLHMKLSLDEKNISSSLLTETKVTYLFKYLEKYMGKSHIIYDIYKFLQLPQFTLSERREFLQLVLTKFPLSDGSEICDISSAETFYLKELLRRAVTGECKTGAELNQIYEQVKMQNKDKSVNSTEIRFYDNIGRLAVSEMYRTRTNSFDMLYMLQFASDCLNNSPANHFIGLQLAHIFTVVGCLREVMELARKMNVKQILWDSVGHLFMMPWLQCPNYIGRNEIWRVNKDRLEKNKREIEDGLVTAFKLGNYAIIPELVYFHNDLSTNVMARLTETEMLYASLVVLPNTLDNLFDTLSIMDDEYIESPNTDLDIDLLFKIIVDKRDLEVVPDFPEFTHDWVENDREESFNEIIEWMKYRTNTMRLLYAGAKVTMDTVVKIHLSLDSEEKNQCIVHEPCEFYDVLNYLHDYYSNKQIPTNQYSTLKKTLPGCVATPLTQRSIPLLLYTIQSLLHIYEDRVLRKDCIEENGLVKLHKTVIEIATETDIAFNRNRSEAWLSGKSTDMRLLGIWVDTVPSILSSLTEFIDCICVINMLLTMLDNILRPFRPKSKVKKRNKKKKGVAETGEVDEETSSEMNQLKFCQLKQLLERYPIKLLLDDVVLFLETNLNNVDVCLNQLSDKNLSPELSVDEIGMIKLMTSNWLEALMEASNTMMTKRNQILHLSLIIDKDDKYIKEFDKLSIQEVSNGI